MTVETIKGQLATIKSIAHQWGEILTNDPEADITPTIDAIQIILNYIKDGSVVIPEPIPMDFEIETNGDIAATVVSNDDKVTVIELEGTEATPYIDETDLFGEVPEACDIQLQIPIICGNKYHVTQVNGMLELFAEDPTIKQEDGEWVKEKDYQIDDEDIFNYSFLVGKGRRTITITISGPNLEHTFFIRTHVHFKES